MTEPLISVIYSNYNRSSYLKAGLLYQLRQTMKKSDFEIVIADDGSTEDYEPVLKDFVGKLRMQWIRFDHTQHPLYAELNPGGKPLLAPYDTPLWYHTPALSHNIALRHARGEVVCITQPEVLMNQDALVSGYSLAKARDRYIFGKPWMSTAAFRQKFFSELQKVGTDVPSYAELKLRSGYTGGEGVSKPEIYWWLSFVKKTAVQAVGGVDEEFLRGVYGEDDDFKLRVGKAGFAPQYYLAIEGIHLDHSDLGGHWNRGGERWLKGAEVNRKRWRMSPKLPVMANAQRVWGDPKLITRHEIYDF